MDFTVKAFHEGREATVSNIKSAEEAKSLIDRLSELLAELAGTKKTKTATTPAPAVTVTPPPAAPPVVVPAPAALPASMQDPKDFAAEAKTDGEEPKKKGRGRPKGSKNKPKDDPESADAATPKADQVQLPVMAPPAAVTAPTLVPPPAQVQVVPPPAPKQVKKAAPKAKKSTIVIGPMHWGVETSEVDIGLFNAKCTQLPDITGDGLTEEDAIADVRQKLAEYMKNNAPTTEEPEAEAELSIEVPDTVLEQESPSTAVYAYLSFLYKADSQAPVERFVDTIFTNWSKVPALAKYPPNRQRLVTIVNQILPTVQAQLQAA